MVPLGLRLIKTRKSRMKLSITDILLFLIPSIFFTVILYIMVGWTFYISFSDWQGTAPNYNFAGLKWYQLMFKLDRFWVDIRNNIIWLLFGVGPTATVAIFLAYILELKATQRFETYIRNLILYPAAMSFLVTGTIWSWMYQPDKGVINTILKWISLDFLTSNFVTDPVTANYWLTLIFFWQYLGFSVIILQSSLRTTYLKEMVEAAAVDGASKMRILFNIVIPNIKGGLLILISLLLISALKVFDIVYIVTFGGPGYSTDVLALFMFIATFQQHLVAVGAGLGVIIFIMALIIVIPYTIYAFRRWFG